MYVCLNIWEVNGTCQRSLQCYYSHRVGDTKEARTQNENTHACRIARSFEVYESKLLFQIISAGESHELSPNSTCKKLMGKKGNIGNDYENYLFTARHIKVSNI